MMGELDEETKAWLRGPGGGMGAGQPEATETGGARMDEEAPETTFQADFPGFEEAVKEWRGLQAEADRVEDLLCIRARECYQRLGEIDPSKVNPYLIEHGLWRARENVMLCEAEEYWRYGGHESHRDSIPTEWLWNFPEKHLLESVERRKAKAARKTQEAQDRERFQRLELFQELKREFKDEDQTPETD